MMFEEFERKRRKEGEGEAWKGSLEDKICSKMEGEKMRNSATILMDTRDLIFKNISSLEI